MIDLKHDGLTINAFIQHLNGLVDRHKDSLFELLTDNYQRIIIQRYFSVMRELTAQGGYCLNSRAYSTLEALSRVIIEQSANMLYVGMDEGENARALLRSSKQLTESNGKAWAAYLASKNHHNPAALARQRNGAVMIEEFDKRWPNTARYPNGKKLFSLLGWENHYHAFYAPLCDSVHSYSDDFSALTMIGDVYALSESEGIQMLQYWNQDRIRLAMYHYAVAVGLQAESFSRICSSWGIELEEDAFRQFEKLDELIRRHDEFDHSRLDEMHVGRAVFDTFTIKM